jgi:RNA recognition motif-containing protein
MRRKSSSRRRRDDSDSDSSSSVSEESVERPEDLFKDLKSALMEKNGSVYRIIYKLEKHYKESVGILRISIPDRFSFNQGDIEEFFKKFGKIERIVLKQNVSKTLSEDQLKSKEGESLAYVIYSEYCSAILAMKVLNSAPEKERIFSAKICHSHPISSEAKLFC